MEEGCAIATEQTLWGLLGWPPGMAGSARADQGEDVATRCALLLKGPEP
jgi:hypothetical protein